MKPSIFSGGKILANIVCFVGVALLSFSGCATVSKVWNRPATQAGLEGLKQAVFAATAAAATESVRQLTTTGKIDPTRLAIVGGASALWTSANYIRTLQATPAVLDPQANADQLAAAGLPAATAAQLAAMLTSNAQILAAQGLPPDAANELAAAAFDAAAADIQNRAK